MGDGYFTDSSVKICTYNFTEVEVLRLINVLNVKFGLKAFANKRSNPNGQIMWRIRISKLSMEKLISLVSPYFIPEMLYKLGIKKVGEYQSSIPISRLEGGILPTGTKKLKSRLEKREWLWAFLKLHYMREHPVLSIGPLNNYLLGKIQYEGQPAGNMAFCHGSSETTREAYILKDNRFKS